MAEEAKTSGRLPIDPEARFAASLRTMREARGWNQSELARRLTDAGLEGFHQTTVSRIEKGDRPVRLGEATIIAEVLGVPVESMTGDGAVLAALARMTSALAEADRARKDLLKSRIAYEAAIMALREAVGDPDPSTDVRGERDHSPWTVTHHSAPRDGLRSWSVVTHDGYPGEGPHSPHFIARKLLPDHVAQVASWLLNSDPAEIVTGPPF